MPQTPLRLLLVATDFEPAAQAAEDLALAVAQGQGAACLLLHAIEEIGGAEDDAFYTALRERAGRLLAERAERFTAAGVSCRVDTVVGPRWRVIVRRAEEDDVDLIVLGSRRPLSEDGPPVLGTTSQQVFFAATRPLLLARS